MKYCPDCGKSGVEGVRFCPQCGEKLLETGAYEEQVELLPESEESAWAAPENTSGQGKLAVVPQELKGWNFGPFALTWIWGVCNNVWISLLIFIPFPLFTLVWAIVLASKGNEWAWQYKRWDSIDHFNRTQGKWNTAGIVVFVISIVIIVLALVS